MTEVKMSVQTEGDADPFFFNQDIVILGAVVRSNYLLCLRISFVMFNTPFQRGTLYLLHYIYLTVLVTNYFSITFTHKKPEDFIESE